MAADFSFLASRPRLRAALLPLAGVCAFLLFLLLTFPYDTLARRIETEAQASGAELTIGSLGSAGLGGLRARDVRLKLPPTPGGEAPPELRFDRADLHPDYLALLLRKTKFSFRIDAYGGNATGNAALSNDPRNPGLAALKLDAHDLDLHALPLRDLGGVEIAGKLQVKANLPTLEPADTAAGSLSISIDDAAITGGAVQGFSVPKTTLGHVDGNAAVEKGLARVEKTSAKGGDVDADVDGTIHLRPLLSLSQAELHVRFRPGDRWLEQNAMIKGALGIIQNARGSDGSYTFTFTGPLTRMTPRPGR